MLRILVFSELRIQLANRLFAWKRRCYGNFCWCHFESDCFIIWTVSPATWACPGTSNIDHAPNYPTARNSTIIHPSFAVAWPDITQRQIITLSCLHLDNAGALPIHVSNGRATNCGSLL